MSVSPDIFIRCLCNGNDHHFIFLQFQNFFDLYTNIRANSDILKNKISKVSYQNCDQQYERHQGFVRGFYVVNITSSNLQLILEKT